MQPLRTRMRADLTSAMKARDRTAVAALRSALAAFDNAEAVPHVAGPSVAVNAHVAAGTGPTEVARRELAAAEIDVILAREITERDSAATEYDAAGRSDRAATVRAEADVLRPYLPTTK